MNRCGLQDMGETPARLLRYLFLVPLLTVLVLSACATRQRRFRIGSEGGLPLPSAHTTVRTVPYTAVQVLRCRSRS